MSVRAAVRRMARRLAVVPPVRRIGVTLARRSPTFRAFGRRVLGTSARAPKSRRPAKARLDIRAGHMMLEGQRARRPIVLLVALGLGPGDTERLAAAVERAQLMTGTFRPLFLVDSGELAPFRSRDYAVETVMPEVMYARVNPHDSYAEYLFERTGSIVAAYGARAVVPLTGAGDELPARMLRLVGALDL